MVLEAIRDYDVTKKRGVDREKVQEQSLGEPYRKRKWRE